MDELKSTLFGSVDQPAALRGKVITNGRLNVSRALGYLTNANPPAIVITALPAGNRTVTNAPIQVTFNRPMNRATVESAFIITPPVSGAFEWTADSRSFSYRHEAPFDSTTNYTVRILGTAQDDNGGTLDGDFDRTRVAASAGTNYSIVVASKDEFDPNLAGPLKLAWYPTPPPGFTGSQFSPTSGVPGTMVTLTGTNFTGATSVLFNGASASFTNAPTNNFDLRITAIVPPDATSGPITIVTPHGNVTSTALFQVLPPPLSIRLAGTNELEIAWPATSPDFVLEMSETMSAGSWSPATQLPTVANGQCKLTLVAAPGKRFYRLKRN